MALSPLSPAWGSHQGHLGATRLPDWGQQRGLGTNSSIPSELTPEPSSPQLLPFAGSIPRFTALSQPSAEIPAAGGCGFAPRILYPRYQSHGITGM